jgi:hypothetical protein
MPLTLPLIHAAAAAITAIDSCFRLPRAPALFSPAVITAAILLPVLFMPRADFFLRPLAAAPRQRAMIYFFSPATPTRRCRYFSPVLPPR